MSSPYGTLSLLAPITIWVCNFYAPMFPCSLLYTEIKFSLNSLKAMLLQSVSLRKCKSMFSLSELSKIQKFIPICNFWLSGKESPCQAGNVSLILGLGRFPGGRNGNLLQYFSLENSMDRKAWQITAKELDTLIYTHSFRKQTKNHLVQIKYICFLRSTAFF